MAADLLSPEWDVLAAPHVPDPTDDFAMESVTVPAALGELFADVRRVQRLREAHALVAFTRLDASDPESEEIATLVRLSRTS
ncbi:hypothetical protein [Streptomyces sp. NPDC002172]